MARKRFENKTNLDPGRLRSKVEFFEESTVDDGWGGVIVTTVSVLVTRGARVKISESSQMAIEAGASVFNQDTYLMIRKRNDFTPMKDMQIEIDGVQYTVRAIIPIDEPQNYWKLLCIRGDWNNG